MKTKIVAFLLAFGVLVLCIGLFLAIIFCPFIELIICIGSLVFVIGIATYGGYHYFLDKLSEKK